MKCFTMDFSINSGTMAQLSNTLTGVKNGRFRTILTASEYRHCRLQQRSRLVLRSSPSKFRAQGHPMSLATSLFYIPLTLLGFASRENCLRFSFTSILYREQTHDYFPRKFTSQSERRLLTRCSM